MFKLLKHHATLNITKPCFKKNTFSITVLKITIWQLCFKDGNAVSSKDGPPPPSLKDAPSTPKDRRGNDNSQMAEPTRQDIMLNRTRISIQKYTISSCLVL